MGDLYKMNTPDRKLSLSFCWPAAAFVFLFVVLLVSILYVNHGLLIFTADDAYVHFKQAENLLHGHYGINRGEFTAPCAGILWTIMLAPLTPLPFFIWAVLLLSSGIVIATLKIQFQIIAGPFQNTLARPVLPTIIFAYLLVCAPTFIANLPALLFSGMDYVWQIFFICLILSGIIEEKKAGRLPGYLFFGLTAASLIRYESLGLVVPTLIYLFIRGHRAKALGAGITIILLLSLFSGFLYLNGAGLLPTAIKSKMIHQISANGFIKNVPLNLLKNLTNLFSLPIIALTMALIPPMLIRRYRSQRGLAAIVLCGAILHLIFGHITFLCRHEAYLLAALATGVLHIYGRDILRWINKGHGMIKMPTAGGALFLLMGHPLIITVLIPSMSNMAYRQPYQLHRLVTQFYQHPVGGNDLGWICYKNPNYVLDLWGAASLQTLECGLRPDSLGCIAHLAKEKKVRLVMITNSWFRNVPGAWIKIGDYHRGRDTFVIEKLFGKILNQVDFYVTDAAYVEEASQAIVKFSQTIPPETWFRFTPDIANRLETGPLH